MRPPFPSPVGTNPSSAQVRFTTPPKTVGNLLNARNRDDPIKFPSIRALDHSSCITDHRHGDADVDVRDGSRNRLPSGGPEVVRRLDLGEQAASGCECSSAGVWPPLRLDLLVALRGSESDRSRWHLDLRLALCSPRSP